MTRGYGHSRSKVKIVFFSNNLVQDGNRELRQKLKYLNNSEYDYGRTTDVFKKRGQRPERWGHNGIDYNSLKCNLRLLNFNVF